MDLLPRASAVCRTCPAGKYAPKAATECKDCAAEKDRVFAAKCSEFIKEMTLQDL